MGFLVYGAGELSIIHHPGSIVFKGHDPIKESTLPEVFTAALGFSTEHFSHWQGFYIENPFNIPEAIVTVAVDGVQDIGQSKGHHFPLLTNDDESRVFKALASRISERYPDEEPSLVRIDFSNGIDDVSGMVIHFQIMYNYLLIAGASIQYFRWNQERKPQTCVAQALEARCGRRQNFLERHGAFERDHRESRII